MPVSLMLDTGLCHGAIMDVPVVGFFSDLFTFFVEDAAGSLSVRPTHSRAKEKQDQTVGNAAMIVTAMRRAPKLFRGFRSKVGMLQRSLD